MRRSAQIEVRRRGCEAPRAFPVRKTTACFPHAHCLIVCLILLLINNNAFAADFRNTLSFQGYTGLLNTPNAEVADEGRLNALYSDQKERMWRSATPREENYLVSVGFFSFVEIGGRLTDAPGAGVRDLSANLKIRVPFIPRGQYLPQVAVGMQDMGGGATHLQTNYLVASEELWRFRFSLGYGAGPDRMKGVFGGAEFTAFDWLSLIGENDTKETNFGVRLITPEVFGFPVTLQVTAKTSLDYRAGNTQFGFGLQFPLGNEHLNRAPLPEKGSAVEPSETKTDAGPAPNKPEGITQETLYANAGTKETKGSADGGLMLLAERLTAEGFQNVKVGTRGETLLVIEYENNRYNHNELDGLGVVIGIATDIIPGGYDTLRVVVKKQDIRLVELSAPFEDFRVFLHDPENYGALNRHLNITADPQDDGAVDFLSGSGNPSWLDSGLVVYPGLKTFVATEVGTFDYLLSAKLDYYLNAWKGAIVNARWDIPVAWSENFDEGKAFRKDRQSSKLDRLMLFQAFKAAPGVMINLGGGMVVHDTYGTLNEVMWTPGNGTHRFLFKQAYTENSNSEAQPQTRQVYLGSYRYHFSPLNLSLEGAVGRFFDNDQGFRVEMKRFFGDTAFSVYYADSITTSRERVKIGGVMIAFPLTPRRDMKPGLLQVRGSDDWSYSQETKIVAKGEANTVATSVGVNPRLPYNLERVFYNRDRLSESYIREHLLRLRDAYLAYVQNP
jgi:hypothetical protein